MADEAPAEERPLREAALEDFDLEELRRRSAAMPDVQEYEFFEYENNPCVMLGYNVGMAMLNAVTVGGAYFFLIAAGTSVTPRCSTYHDRRDLGVIPSSESSTTWEEWMCNISTFCFWTYPMLGSLVVVFLYWKNLVDSRLYYECLLNRVLLDFKNLQYVYSPSFWLLLVYGICGVSSLIYIKSASASSNKTYRELVYGLLAYFAPVAAFVFVLFRNWSVEWHTVPLGKYCERNHRGAVEHLDRSTLVREGAFVEAFEAAEDLLQRYATRHRLPRPVELTTREFVLLVLDMFKKGARAPRGWLCSPPRCCRSYWVSRVLFSRHVQDRRASTFRFFARCYMIFLLIAVVIFCWTFMHTAHELLVLQGVLKRPLPLGPNPHDMVRGPSQLGAARFSGSVVWWR